MGSWTFAGFLRHGLKAAIYAGLVCIGGICGLFPKVQAASFEHRLRWSWLVFLIPAWVSFVLVAVISPVDEPRYIYNLMPAFVLTVSFLIDILERTGGKKVTDAIRTAAFLAVACLALYQARSAPPDYLYPEHAAYNAALAEHKGDPCVFFAAPRCAFVPITEDLIQLLTFPEVYVTDQESLEPMRKYVGQADEVVVYIDVSEFWSSGYDSAALLRRIADETDYKQAEQLFVTGLSETYLIRK